MKRTQVQLDEASYRALKRKAFERGVSMSALLREILHEQLNPAPAPRRWEGFRFIGSGQSEQGSLAPVSERHDEALAEDFAR
ncbi:MAG: ribbon-helix-helix protein, CopG family [Chloroflexi bacterium]|nr:ribbon-helix-helix protein, CopG family [Chloroflexota bacterium]